MDIAKTYPILDQPLEISVRAGESQESRRPVGEVGIGEISLSYLNVMSGESVQVSATVGGKGIAYIFAEAMLYDVHNARLYGPLRRAHIRAPHEQVTRGVARPVWNETEIVSYEYRPVLRLLSSGEGATFGFLTPESYPTEGVETIWKAEGEYTLGASGNTYRAVLSFGDDGTSRGTTVFKKARFGERPSRIHIRQGDRFTPRVLSLWRDPAGIWQEEEAFASPLQLEGAGVHWLEQPCPLDEMYVGFAVRDFDDCWARRYVPLAEVVKPNTESGDLPNQLLSNSDSPPVEYW